MVGDVAIDVCTSGSQYSYFKTIRQNFLGIAVTTEQTPAGDASVCMHLVSAHLRYTFNINMNGDGVAYV